MKLYKRNDFIKEVRAGSIYTCGIRWAFSELSIKGKSIENDFYYQPLTSIDSGHESYLCLFDKLTKMDEEEISYPLNKDMIRDGSYDNDHVFLVYEKEDLEYLYNHIGKLLGIDEK